MPRSTLRDTRPSGELRAPAVLMALLGALLVAGAAIPLAAQAGERPPTCSSDGRPRPQALMERFISADCADCWRDPATPAAPPGTLALDWVVPGARGDDAPLSAVALPEAAARLAGVAPPVASGPALTLTRALAPDDRARPQPLRVALGLAINDYIGASIRLRPAGSTGTAAWLLLVERVPAGTEGSPVERRLVRGVFRPDWDAPRPGRVPARLEELRPMRVAEGARAERLELVGWVEDAQGRPRAIALADCAPQVPARQRR